ncbi:hypothetical protein FOBRF1_012077 [Fusarium oxysporum]
MSISSDPVYFELSWSILSTIGIGNFLFGLLVCTITSFSQISAIPLITSAAGATANGLCYYAFYTQGYPVKGKAVASAFADLFWLEVIDNLHIGYFVSIATVECINAYFLLTIFASAKTSSLKAAIKAGPFRYLMRSAEVRLALLAVIGVTRAITYSFQTTAQSATNVASQLDRFAYTMECLFPVVMLIDMLASRLVFTDQAYTSSSRSRTPRICLKQLTSNTNEGLYSVPPNDQIVEIHRSENIIGRTSSQERILESGVSQRTASEIVHEDINGR